MQKKKGISLIVLVITIIVMIILASSVVLTLNNSGIISKSKNAVDSSNDVMVKERLQLAWADEYAKGNVDLAKLEEAVRKENQKLEGEGVDISKYSIEVTLKGVKVVKQTTATENDGWVQNGTTVTKGKITLNVGDKIEYDETKGGTVTGIQNVDWKVLGAKDGQLLIMSTKDVGYITCDAMIYEGMMADVNQEELQTFWLNASQLSDKTCEAYGNGTGALSVRALRIEDINRITDYDATKVENMGSTVRYSYNGTTKPSYSSDSSNGTLLKSHNIGFYYYNGKEFLHIEDLKTGTIGKAFATITNSYKYSIAKLQTNNPKAYSLIESIGSIPASTAVETTDDYVVYGNYDVSKGGVLVSGIWTSDGDLHDDYWFNEWEIYTHAVVTLSKDITLQGNSIDGWTF